MKTNFFKTALVTSLTFLLAGNLFAQEINLNDFNEISIQDNIDVVITQSTLQNYRIEPSDVNLKVTNQLGKLKISREDNKEAATIYINCIKLSAIDVLGSADVRTTNEIQSDDLKLALTGSGDLRVKLKANNVSAALAGSGDINLEGTTQNLTTTVAGSGDLRASKLVAENVKVEVAGSGDATVNASKSLDASVAGSGDIRYVGNPATRNVNIVGSGSISETSQEKADKQEIVINSEIKIKTEGGNASSNDTTRLSFGDRKIIIIDYRSYIISY